MVPLKNSTPKYLFIFSFLLISFISKGQIIRNETISSWGTATIISTDGIKIQQSVGQLSVIGNFSTSKWTASQGFLRGLPSRFLSLPEPFFVVPFPNPFVEQISFRFTPKISEEASIIIYDMNGKEVYQSFLKPKENEAMINLYFLSNSVYLVFIKMGNRAFQTRIIKKS